jgi:hypothetical protein
MCCNEARQASFLSLLPCYTPRPLNTAVINPQTNRVSRIYLLTGDEHQGLHRRHPLSWDAGVHYGCRRLGPHGACLAWSMDSPIAASNLAIIHSSLILLN